MPGILDTLKQLRETVETAQATDTVADRLPAANGTQQARKNLNSGRTPSTEEVIGVPHTRLKGHSVGADPLSSRPFSFKNALGLISGALQPHICRTEVAVLDEFTKSIRDMYPEWSPMPGTILLPISAELISGMDAVKGPAALNAIKSLGFQADDRAIDPEEVAHVRQQTGQLGAVKSMGSLNYGQGGALIPNPAFGDLIRLARNTPGLFSAGCSTVAIPPQGAIDFPRVKSATEVGFIDGENDTIAETQLGTDQMKLEAKIVSGIVTISNKLMMMSMPAAESIVQEDLILSVLLKLDYYGFFGGGGQNIKGIINMVADGVHQVVPSTVAANGDTLAPEDWFNKFWVPCAQANRTFTGWVMNPRAYAANVTVRADAVTAADKAGVFVNNLVGALGTPLGHELERWFGYKVTWTNQIPVTRTKGTSTNLSAAFGGPWNEAVMGLFGAVQVLLNPYETTAYSTLKTKVRVTALGDFNLRYPKAFTVADGITN